MTAPEAVTIVTALIERLAMDLIEQGVEPGIIAEVLLAQGGALLVAAVGREQAVKDLASMALMVSKVEEDGHGQN